MVRFSPVRAWFGYGSGPVKRFFLKGGKIFFSQLTKTSICTGRHGTVWHGTVLVADRYGSRYRFSDLWLGHLETTKAFFHQTSEM